MIYEFENLGAGDNPLRREIFHIDAANDEGLEPGWYWMPAEMVSFDPTGPFASEAEAIRDAQ